MISRKARRICSMAAAITLTAATFGNYPASEKAYKTVNAASAVKVEFEDGTFTEKSVKGSTIAGFSGTGYVDSQEGDLSVTVNVDATDIYEFTIGYCLPEDRGSKIQDLYVNGTAQGQISFAPTDKFKELKVNSVKLNKGENTITMKKSWGWIIFDYLSVDKAVLPEIKADKELSDPKATDAAKNLMSYLVDSYGKNIISGQQEYYGTSREDEFKYIYDLSGKYPAIRGFDFGDTCPLYAWDDGIVKRIVSWTKEKGGIATASWHINVPVTMKDYKVGDTLAWEKTTYSEKTDFVTANVMKEGTAEHDYFLLAVENLAKELKKIDAEGVPLLFRPFHEAEGGGGADGKGAWFWWGKEGTEVYKELYAYLYELLTEKYNLHNLIWEFNSYTYEESYKWYPGDKYVDLVGYDKYNATNWTTNTSSPNESAITSTFYSLVDMYSKDGKPIAMMENDTIPSLENLTSEKASWLYFCPWYGDHLMSKSFNDPEKVKEMYKSEYCITLDELPKDLYGAGGLVTKPEEPDKPAEPSKDGRYEFEDGTISGKGSTKVASDSAASKGKYVYLQNAGDAITFEVTAEKAGLYKFVFGYQQAYDEGGKIQNFFVNGVNVEAVSFPYTKDFIETSGTVVSLKEGKNTIKMESSWGWTNLDYFTFTEAQATVVDATGAKLSNKNSSKATQSLYSYICKTYGSSIISGQQESTWMSSPDYEMDYIEEVSGKLPAMRGLDYMGDDFKGVNERAKEWYKKGGIVTICWHCGSDFSGNYDDSKADDLDWDKALTPGTAEYDALIKAMDKGAEALTELKEAGVPVIWRPFHEFDGAWFWWGKGGAENFKKLWQMMYDRYTNHWKLDNLIWTLGFTSSVPASWYPGDEYVDIVGADTYADSDSSLIGMYNKVLDLVGTDVPIILHENGIIPDPEKLEAEGSKWMSFMTWHTEYIKNSNTKEHIKDVYTSDYVITLDELPKDLYTVGVTDKPVTDKPVTDKPVTDKPVTDKIVYGDLNGDGVVEVTDLTYMSLFLLGDIKFDNDQKEAADVSYNGKVDIADLAHLKQYIMTDPVKLGK